MSALMAKLVRRVTSNDEINGSNPFQSIKRFLSFFFLFFFFDWSRVGIGWVFAEGGSTSQYPARSREWPPKNRDSCIIYGSLLAPETDLP